MSEISELDMQNIRPIRSKKTKKNKVNKNIILINCFLIALILGIVFISPVFQINEIVVNGVSHLTAEKIIETSSIKIHSNMFLFWSNTVEKRLDNLSFVNKTKVIRKFPNTVIINITESKPLTQVLCGQSLYIIIDNTGKILDTTSEKLKYAVPVIEGINVTSFAVGEKIVSDSDEELLALIDVCQELYNNMMIDKVANLYTTDTGLKIGFSDGIIADVGNGKNTSYRIRFLKEVFAKIQSGETGVVEFIDEYKAVFKPDEK